MWWNSGWAMGFRVRRSGPERLVYCARPGERMALKALAWVSGVYDLALAIPMLFAARETARLFGAPESGAAAERAAERRLHAVARRRILLGSSGARGAARLLLGGRACWRRRSAPRCSSSTTSCAAPRRASCCSATDGTLALVTLAPTAPDSPLGPSPPQAGLPRERHAQQRDSLPRSVPGVWGRGPSAPHLVFDDLHPCELRSIDGCARGCCLRTRTRSAAGRAVVRSVVAGMKSMATATDSCGVRCARRPPWVSSTRATAIWTFRTTLPEMHDRSAGSCSRRSRAGAASPLRAGGAPDQRAGRASAREPSPWEAGSVPMVVDATPRMARRTAPSWPGGARPVAGRPPPGRAARASGAR